ncbi:MAG: hypothetical protein DMF94_04925 [Acidobacteria bacterium]|nr:MAG: hypothetical protein DMF94_04925 [Acidobacteriota bacterium]
MWFKRLLAWLNLWRSRPPGSPRDPYAWKPAPLKPRPRDRSGAVAVAEPDDESTTINAETAETPLRRNTNLRKLPVRCVRL